MPFEKGHKLSTGRPKGSLNKANSETKKFIFLEEGDIN